MVTIAVAAAQEGGEARGAEQAGVAHLGDGARGIERERQIAGGAVVALAEGGGDDEDARWWRAWRVRAEI